jgi:hypothetical protein
VIPRLLAVVAVGFLLSSFVGCSCGPSKCTAENCKTGCCDSAGKCVSAPNNTNNTSCGAIGSSCSDCSKLPGQVCDSPSKTCVSLSASDGGASGCDGCLLPNGMCVNLANTSVTNCGRNGASCAPCPSGQVCGTDINSKGTCFVAQLNKKVGDACADDNECQSMVAPAGSLKVCKKMTSTGNAIYVGGYCTIKGCDVSNSANSCPAESSCIRLFDEYGEADAICWDKCSGTDLCRTPGYACTALGCWISPQPALDRADKVGNACANDLSCQNPPLNGGQCLDNRFGRNWRDNGGYCSRVTCGSNRACSVDGSAICLDFGTAQQQDKACVKSCAESGPAGDAGQSDCRAGYLCESYLVTRFADGGVPMRLLSDGGMVPTAVMSTDGVCLAPEFNPATNVGGPCSVTADCRTGGADGTCFLASTQNPDGGIPVLTGFTEGYCSRACQSDVQCGAGAGGLRGLCLNTGFASACFATCDSPGTNVGCRPDYVCRAYVQTDGGASMNEGYCEPGCLAPGFGACPPRNGVQTMCTSSGPRAGFCQ